MAEQPNLAAATIPHLDLTGSKLAAGLHAYRDTITHDLPGANATSIGTIHAADASIGLVDLEGAELTNETGITLDLDGATITGSLSAQSLQLRNRSRGPNRQRSRGR